MNNMKLVVTVESGKCSIETLDVSEKALAGVLIERDGIAVLVTLEAAKRIVQLHENCCDTKEDL